jgi:hypothetical protein
MGQDNRQRNTTGDPAIMSSLHDVNYGLALMHEQMSVSGQWLLVRLGLKRMTIQERYDLNIRTDLIQRRVKEWKK